MVAATGHARAIHRLEAALVAAVALLVRLPGLTARILNPDEAYYSVQARVLLHGGSLYRDAVDRKPPGLPYLTAAIQWVVGHPSVRAMRLVDALALAATAVLVGSLARRRSGEAAALAAPLLYLAAVAALPARDAQAFTSETWVALGTIAALWWVDRDRLVAAGLALAGACLMRQTAVLFVPAVAIAAWPRFRWRGVATLVGIPAAVALAAAAALGIGDTWFWVVGSGGDGYLGIHGRYRETAELAQDALGVIGLAVVPLLVLVPAGLGRWRDTAEVWAGVVGGLVAATVGLRFFPHYALQGLPWLALAAGSGWAALGRGAARRAVVALAAGVAALGIGLSLAAPPGISLHGDAVSASIRRHSRPGDPIFVWGHATEYYLLADRPPATRFLTSGFLTGYSGGRPPGPDPRNRPVPGAWSMLRDDVAAHPPELIVDVAASGFRNGDAYPIEDRAYLRRLLARRYRLVEVVDGVRIYRRRLVPAGDDELHGLEGRRWGTDQSPTAPGTGSSGSAGSKPKTRP
jgi:hypothetical protein